MGLSPSLGQPGDVPVLVDDDLVGSGHDRQARYGDEMASQVTTVTNLTWSASEVEVPAGQQDQLGVGVLAVARLAGQGRAETKLAQMQRP